MALKDVPGATFRRYAIYLLPDGDLGDRGAAWLGWDARRGRDLPLPPERADWTEGPRRYGFHATLKPPFRLAPGRTLEELQEAVAHLCAGHAALTLPGFELATLGRFLALLPLGDPAPLKALAASVVRGLDPFRAPQTEEELARRDGPHLSTRQAANLRTWGYPHVIEDFRCHLTLTRRLAGDAREQAKEAAKKHFAPDLAAPYRIEDLALLGEDDRGFFHQVARFPLSG